MLQQEECAIENILDIRQMNGFSGRYQLLIAWIKQDTEERSTSWESFEQINKDAPLLVKEFFQTLDPNREMTYDKVL